MIEIFNTIQNTKIFNIFQKSKTFNTIKKSSMGPKVNMKYFLWNKVDRQNVVDARYSVSVYNHAALSEEYAVNAQNYALFSEQIPSEISLDGVSTAR